MRFILLVALAMVAFAANSLLNRVAIAEGAADPAGFAAVRVASGALVLWIVAARVGQPVRALQPGRVVPALALTLYFLGFSFAYLTLDAGVGALILFGGVQLTMFGGGLLGGERPPMLRWVGMGVGLAGLVLLFWPLGTGTSVDPLGALLMAGAALGWGVYSLKGRASRAPIGDTAASFVLSAPIVAAGWLFSGEGWALTPLGLLLAVVSGVVTSGLGYALWYSVLPRLEASVAALSQLTVPVIAVAAGAVLLGEAAGVRTILSAALVVGGVALGIAAVRPTARSAPGDRS